MDLPKRKLELVAKAFSQFGKISLCAGKTLDECFQNHDGKLWFYFNNDNFSTRTVREA
jgi:hypothetical protein